MSTTVNNIPVYDRFAPPAPTTSNGTSSADLSKNFLKMLTVQLRQLRCHCSVVHRVHGILVLQLHRQHFQKVL